jgi:hypothetical protein
MNADAKPPPRTRWPLPRILILILAGAFLNLLIDIRVEHVDVVRERTIAWLPILYSAIMAVAALFAAAFWNNTSRRIMLALFLLAFVVGGTGVYLHNHGNLTKVLQTSVNAWTDPNIKHVKGPPQIAPLAFAGLGLIGILASLKRFNS